jgi:hypothetical protein
MPKIDQTRISLIQEIMSRPFRTLSALSLTAFSLGLFGCETLYRPIYSNERNYFKAPDQYAKVGGAKQKSAEEIMKEADAASTPAPSSNPLDPGAAMPPAAPPAAPDAAAMPGMTPATPPATPPAN